jgi:predicted MFS family arabinose efflux permease
MSTTAAQRNSRASAAPDRLPRLALLLLTAMGFILVSAETMPAGLLPQIANGMGVPEGVVGQFVGVWALGTVIVTVPAIALTRSLRRKPLLLSAITGLVVANSVTALSDSVPLSLASRFIAGAFTGIIWAMFATYARRISPPEQAGRSLAIVSSGAPLGFALGTPLGAWLGTTFDWRWSFGGLTALTVVVLALIVVAVPDAPGAAASARLSPGRVLAIPGVAIVLAVIAAWMLAHNTIYTYIAPFLRAGGTGLGPDLVLFLYGMASLGGIAVTGVCIDRRPRALLRLSVAAFIAAGAVLLVGHDSVAAILIGTALWGLAFGGASAQLQAALTHVSGEHADVASSFLPVAFNVAIFAAGLLGAGLLTAGNALLLAVVMVALGLIALLLVFAGRRTAFTAMR